jgi:hypothetical protein
MAITQGTTSDGKLVQLGDAVSVKGIVTAVNAGTGTGPGPNGGSQVSLTVQCNGAAAAPGAAAVPYNITVLATDVTASQSL